MSGLKTLAIDDEGPALRRLIKMVESHPELSLIGSAKSAEEAKSKIIVLKPELLLLDIQLKDATAFDLLSEIENKFDGKIIFITAYDQYAVKAFEYEAIDYLIKPYTQQRFNVAINKIISKTGSSEFKDLMNILNNYVKQSRTITIPEGAKNHFIDKAKILYLTADGYYTTLILTEGKKIIRISLRKLEELLPDNFIRINKSVIINKDFIQESTEHKMSAKILMIDRNEFYVSNNFISKFKNDL